MAYGNTSVSALLNQARSALKKQQSLEEEVAAYEYDLSPKDQASFNKYQDFLAARVKQVQSTDPSKSLSLQRKITGAQRTFTSAELTRESIGIAEGSGSKPQKLNKMIQLYRSALENGDENLAQRIQLQADQLQVQIQNEAMSKGLGGGGGGGKAPNQTAAENRVAQLKDDLAAMVDAVKKGGNKALGEIESVGGGKTYFGTVKGIIEEIAQTYQGLADSTSDPAKKQQFLEKAKSAAEGNYEIGFGKSKNLNDISKYIEARSVGGNITSLQNNIDGTFQLKENPRAGAMYVAGPDGKPTLVDKYAGGGDANYEKYYKAAQENLKANGITSSVNNGVLSFYNDQTGQTVEGTADQNGNILYKTVDSQGNDIVRRFVTKEKKDELVSQQEQDAVLKAGNVATDGSVDVNRPGEDDVVGRAAYDTMKSASSVLANATKNKNLGTITGLAGGLGIANPFAKLGGIVGNSIGAVGAIGDLTKKLTGLKQESDNKKAADAALRAEEFRANQAAIAAANRQQEEYKAQIVARSRQNVALPYEATPEGQKAASVIGSSAFNQKYLGGTNSLYNKYLR